MFKIILAVVTLSSSFAMARDVVKRWNLKKDKSVELILDDDRPVAINLLEEGWSQSIKLKFEGTYGSDQLLSPEYFAAAGTPSRSGKGAGHMKVVVSYVSVGDKAQVGGFTLHGEYGVCVDAAVGKEKCVEEIKASSKRSKGFAGESFSYGNGQNTREPFLPAVVSNNEGILPFCTLQEGLKDMDEVTCGVSVLDIYDPLDAWFAMISFTDNKINRGSGSNYSYAKFGEADGNGILLAKAKEPKCVADKSCVIYAGYARYFRGKKKTYFAVQIELREGKPTSAVAHDLAFYDGKVEH